MTDLPDPRPTRRDERNARDERLARALRENLRRRKEQARLRAPQTGETQPDAVTTDGRGERPT